MLIGIWTELNPLGWYRYCSGPTILQPKT